MNRRILITAGPTHEPIDAVRYLGNRSSGILGVALAQAAQQAGWSATLLLGPTAISTPPGIPVFGFQTAEDLQKLLQHHFPQSDVLIMAAAVADYRPSYKTTAKLQRNNTGLTVELQPTPDLVAECAKSRRKDQRIIGFALEELADLRARAQQKLDEKQLDAIVANPLQTMGAPDIDATLFTADGRHQSPGRMSKPDFARWLIQRIDQLFTSDNA